MSTNQVNILSPNYPRNQDDSSESEDLIQDLNVGETLSFRNTKLNRLSIMVRGSKVDSVVKINELQDSVTHHWGDVMESIGVTKPVSTDEWEIVKKLLERAESDLTVNDIMTPLTISAFQPMMASLYEDMDYEFYAFFRKSVTLPNIPECLVVTGLDRIYEQIIFYEYIYSSSIYSLYHKISWMIDNRYDELIDLIDNHHLDLWDRKRDPTPIDEYSLMLYEYTLMDLDDRINRVNQLQRLLDLHTQIMSFNIEDMYEGTELHADTIRTMRTVTDFFRQADETRGSYIESNRVELRRIARTSGKTSRDLDSIPLIDIYVDYVAIDMLMQIIEADIDIGLSDASRSNIIYEWLVYSSRMLRGSNCRYMVITKSNGEVFVTRYLMRTYSRCLKMSQSMVGPLRLVNIDFESMLSIYLHDLVDIFRIITRNCEFQEIDPSIVTYYPIAIINYISEKTGRSIQKTVSSIRSNLEISLHLLMRMGPSRLGFLGDIIFKGLFGNILNQTDRRVSIQNLFSYRIDPMNEDIITLHELDELNHLNDVDSNSLTNVLNTLFLENGRREESKFYFDHGENFANLGVLSYVYLRTINGKDVPQPLVNYTSYLTSIVTFDRIAPSIPDIIGCMQFLSYHSQYLPALNEYIEMRNEMVREYSHTNKSGWETIDRDMVYLDPHKYGQYVSEDESESDVDSEFESDSDLESDIDSDLEQLSNSEVSADSDIYEEY